MRWGWAGLCGSPWMSVAFGLCAAGLWGIVVASDALSFTAKAAAGATMIPAKARSTKIEVFAGEPSVFAFKLSQDEAPIGTIVFEVTNKGRIDHNFRICSSPYGGSADSCAGLKTTPLLAPGKSAAITVTLRKGVYEYLCTVAGQAAGGM